MEFFFTRNAIQRIYERSIDKKNIKLTVEKGEVLQEYPDDKPFPSCLILYFIDNNPLHVVCSIKTEEPGKSVIIITVYEPSPEEWDEDFKKRRV